jgi:RNA polymerase sigma factor (sigma-70 family)
VTEAAADWVLAPRPMITATPTSRERGWSAVAAEQLYRELAPAVLGYLRSQHVPAPEDVLGEVFFHVARDAHRVDGDHEKRRRWVFTIAHRRLVDAWRHRAVRPQIVDGPPPDLPSVDDPVSIVDAELQDALDALTDDQRTVVLLRFVADLSLRDVARITGRRVGAVKALQCRGLDQLERALSNGR